MKWKRHENDKSVFKNFKLSKASRCLFSFIFGFVGGKSGEYDEKKNVGRRNN